jgi:hypothetical protein
LLATACKKDTGSYTINSPVDGATYHTTVPIGFHYYDPSHALDTISYQIFLASNDSLITTGKYATSSTTNFTGSFTYNTSTADSFLFVLNLPYLGAQTSPPTHKFYITP